jgi:hypothetical protein
MYIRRVQDNAYSPPDDYPCELCHPSHSLCDSRIGLATFPDATNVLTRAVTCSRTYPHHSHPTPIPVISDPSYSRASHQRFQ